jgi:hypothetical protein
MKSSIHLLLSLISLLVLSFGPVDGQEASPIDWLKEYRGEIPVGSYTYWYEYSYFNKELCGISIKSVKISKKGDESVSRSELYLSDIDENAVTFKVTGKYITVNLETKNSQKFIRYFEDGEFDSYVSSVEIYTDQVDKARSLIDLIKEKLKECNRQEKFWSSLQSGLDWLKDNISTTTQDGTEYNQSFSYDGAKNYLVKYNRNYNDSKGSEIREVYSFNLADVDPEGVSLNVRGTDLSIELNTKNNKYIGISENGEIQNYDNDFEILVPSLEEARDIVQAFKYAVPQCKPEYTSFSDANQASLYLKEHIREITSGSYKYTQSFDQENKPHGIVTYISKRTDSKGTTTESKYQLYLSEFQPEAELSVSGTNVILELNVKDKQKLIMSFEDGELQNYSNQIEIYAADIESARELANAFNYAVLNSDPGLLNWTDAAKASAWLSSNTGTVAEPGATYEQKLSFDPGNNYKTVLNVLTIDSKGQTDEVFEFYVSDIDRDNLKLSTSGKKMFVEVSTGKEKLVRVTKSGEIQNYASSVDFLFEDTRQARNFINALKYLASGVQQQEKSFADSRSAFKYISSSLTTVSTGSYKYDQSIEMIEDDPCRIKFMVTQLDSKDVSTGYIYEFTMSDINPESVKLEISGKEMTVELETKAKQKLIKPYKNGEPQNFDYDFEIFTDDVVVARNIIGAIKTMAGNCGK